MQQAWNITPFSSFMITMKLLPCDFQTIISLSIHNIMQTKLSRLSRHFVFMTGSTSSEFVNETTCINNIVFNKEVEIMMLFENNDFSPYV